MIPAGLPLDDAGAEFSPCRTWRYKLWRRWKRGPAICNFLMLNPSTADELTNDPTVERCQQRAIRMGFDGLVVTNLFAYRSTDPQTLKLVRDPVGPANDRAILAAAADASMVICAWGSHGTLHGRALAVTKMLESAAAELYALKLTKDGQPQHPLYLPYNMLPQPYEAPATPANDNARRDAGRDDLLDIPAFLRRNPSARD